MHNYYVDLKAAEADAPTICWGSPTNDVQLVKPPACRKRMVAALPVHQKFLKDLDSTPAPPQFAAQDRAFRIVVPEGVTDINAVIAAADTGSRDAVLQATIAYVNDMMPGLTDPLDVVDPSVTHI